MEADSILNNNKKNVQISIAFSSVPKIRGIKLLQILLLCIPG